ncbi:hypothetical protein AVEN_135285-1 [Araneus ventricosus]|uniref:Uncharacterized protein n=1 Tax=Araneus ventricosus TaxID=182803 RepID=A0A4Y2CPU2_ARAVE|nr:hypothetical protein AVEN_135285-1 [Araneus ventricosus]
MSKTYEIRSKWIGSGGILKNSKSKTPYAADSNLEPRCEGSVKTKDLPTLSPRVEARNETRNPPSGGRGSGWQEFCDFEPCLKTNFGTSVYALPNFSTEIVGGKTDLGEMAHKKYGNILPCLRERSTWTGNGECPSKSNEPQRPQPLSQA